MTGLWVVGGEQRLRHSAQPEWTMFRRALVLRVEGSCVERVLSYESPPEHRPDRQPSVLFKAATMVDGTAYLCTQTEVLLCDLPSFRIRRVISYPCFNDLHHVTVGADGSIWVVVTGLDAVAQLTPEGELCRLVSVVGGSVWDRFSPDVDYRKVPTLKPHRAHPNYLFFVDGRPWVTRLEQRDAVALDDEARIELHAHGIHDGQVVGEGVWFTGVDGHLIRAELATGELRRWNLNDSNPTPDVPLGWCRSLLVDEPGGRAWVGFSRIRYTRLRQNLSWVRHGFARSVYHRVAPTRIAAYDLDTRAVLAAVDLEPAGMGAVFSIHDQRGDRAA